MEFKSFEELFMDETKNGVKIPTSGYLKKGKKLLTIKVKLRIIDLMSNFRGTPVISE